MTEATKGKEAPGRLLVAEDVAHTLNLTRQHVYVLAASGQLPSIKLRGGRGSVRFDPKDVEAFIKAHRRGGAHPKNAA
jgi:excisionase family DNA binding protein